MAEEIRKVDHYSTEVPNKAGEGAKLLGALRDAGVNLIALWGYPLRGRRRAQFEIIPDSGAALTAAAKKAGIVLSKKRTAFFISGDDRVGAVADAMAKLARAGINVGAVQAVCGGAGRFGAVVFVAPEDVRKASKALGI